MVTVSTGLWWATLATSPLSWFSFGQTKYLWYLQLQDLFCPTVSCFAELQLLQIVAGIKLPTEPLEKARRCSLQNLPDSVTFISCRSDTCQPCFLFFCGVCRPSNETVLFSESGPEACFSCKMAHSHSCPCICQVHLRCYFLNLISLYQ